MIGHKTMADGSHLPLRRDEADTIFEAADAARAQRERDMPTEQSAIAAMQEAFTRLKELGWREAIYCPKDGSQFFMIEPGSTGIHQGHYQGKWPNGYWTDGDYGMRPCLFKLSPEDEAKRKAKMAEAAEKFRRNKERWHAARGSQGRQCADGRMGSATMCARTA
jgi:hypothetical protein